MSTILERTIGRADSAPEFVEAEVRYVIDDGIPPYRYIDWPEMDDKDASSGLPAEMREDPERS